MNDKLNIPGTAYRHLDGQVFRVRDMTVSLDDVAAEQKKNAARMVFVYADTVRLEGEFAFGRGALEIAARRLEIGPVAKLTLATGGRLMLYTTPGEPALPVAVAAARAAVQVTGGNIGVRLTAGASGIEEQSIAGLNDSAGLGADPEFRRALVSTYLAASVSAQRAPDEARAMFAWVQRMTHGVGALSDLFLSSSTAAVLAGADGGEVPHVPALDAAVYRDGATTYIAAAKGFEADYQRFMDDAQDVERRQEAARAMLAWADADARLAQQLVDEARAEVVASKKNMAVARALFSEKRSLLAAAKAGFEVGLRQYRDQQKVEAVIESIQILVGLGIAVGAASLGDEAAAVSAIGEAINAGESFEATMQKMVDQLDLVTEISSNIDALASRTDALSEGRMDEAAKGLSPGAEGTALLVRSAWEDLENDASSLLQSAVEAGVPDADGYRTALLNLVDVGQTLADIQLVFIRAGRKLIRMALSEGTAKAKKAAMSDYIAKLGADARADDTLAQQFYSRYLDVKLPLFLLLSEYRAAYYYNALERSALDPSIDKPIAELEQDLRIMYDDYVAALTSFQPPPQPFTGKRLRFADPAVIRELKSERRALMSIGVDASAFAALDRVRVEAVRVRLDGAPARGAYAVIETVGSYADRLGDRRFHFTAAPYRRIFETDSDGRVVVDGRVDHRDKDAYFEPTPFVTWSVRFPADKNPSLELGSVQSVELEFDGSAVGRV